MRAQASLSLIDPVARDQRLRSTARLGGAAEILLAFPNPLRSALHLGLENLGRDAAQKIQGGGHCCSPCPYACPNHAETLRVVCVIRSDPGHKILFSI